MIIQKQISGTLVKTHSDKNVYIHGGYPEADYAEVIDPISMNRTYVETDIPIVHEEEYNPEEAVQAIHILLGNNL